jgi:two-component system, OmpR family, sensor histidine kinase KdpD
MNAHTASQPDTTNVRPSAYPGGPDPESQAPGRRPRTPASDTTGATHPLERDASDMNDPSVAMSLQVIVPRFTLASVTTDVLAFLAAAVAGFVARDVAGGATAAADRMRAALLAAVSCLRSPDLQLAAADRDELLATAEESLDLLSRLAASLLDVTRLQAGARSVFPRPADLEEIIAGTLAGLGRSGRSVRVDLPPGLPQVVADPPVMERVIANLTANALRYSPAGSPPRLTASARGGRIEVRVIDCGPGVPEADRDRMFAPFQRLGEAGSTTGVGLGLAVSRGLTQAMSGTLQPAQTPGGGLTMTMSLPAAPRPGRRRALWGGVEPPPVRNKRFESLTDAGRGGAGA